MEIVGVLGGTGPVATYRFLEYVINTARDDFGAEDNDAFPHVLLSSIPVTPPTWVPGTPTQVPEFTLKRLEAEAAALAGAGAEFLVIPCNTLHLYLDRFSTAAKRPFVSIIDVVRSAMSRQKPKRVALLGTRTTIEEGLYLPALEAIGASPMVPDAPELDAIMHVVRRGIGGRTDVTDAATIARMTRRMMDAGADAILLGCTELSLLDLGSARTGASEAPVYDPLRLLAMAACERAYGRSGKP